MNDFQSGLLKSLASALLVMTGILSSSAADVIVSPSVNAVAGKGNWGHTEPGYREFITIGKEYRIRQSGAITMVKLYTADTVNITGFYIKIWRKSVNGYDLVGKSENIASKLVNGDIATITLNTPIAGIQEGDYCGYRLEESGGHYAFYAISDSNAATYLITDATPAEKDFNWETKLKISSVLPIELYMPPLSP